MKFLSVVKGFIKGVSYTYKALTKTTKVFKTIMVLADALKGVDKQIADIWNVKLDVESETKKNVKQ